MEQAIQSLGTTAPRLLDLVRDRLRLKHYSLRTGQAYVHWVKRYIIHHGRRHPKDMGKQEGETFLTSLAAERDVRAATQGQGLSVILFLYREVLEHLLPWQDEVTRTKRPARVSSVRSREEVQRLIAGVEDPLPGLIIAPPDMRNCRERGSFARPADLPRRNLPFPSAVQGRRVIHRP